MHGFCARLSRPSFIGYSSFVLQALRVIPGNSMRTASLSDLVALNEEMAALVRAGTPLEQGLAEFGGEMAGQTGEIATRLGQRLQAGETLSKILADRSLGLPRVWTAMVDAGCRAGRLSEVLESLAATGRRIAENRRTIATALVYPVVVTIVAYLVFVFLVLYLSPILAGAYLDLTGSPQPFVAALAWLGTEGRGWLLVPPIAMCVILLVEWLLTRRGFTTSEGPLRRGISKLWPSIGRAQADARLATFSEILSLLVRERTPLGDAIVLAANATGDRHASAAANALAQHLEHARTPTEHHLQQLSFPPFLRFLLLTGQTRPDLGEVLAETAEHYRERSNRTAQQTALVLPILLSAIVGGTVTLAVGAATILPIWQLIMRLGNTT